MAANRNRLMPQLQECECLVLPSASISHVALDHALHAEGHVRMLPHDFVGIKAQDHGGTPARKAGRVEAPLKAKGLLTQTGPAGGGNANHVGPTVRVKSWAKQAVQTGISHLTQDAPTNLTKGWGILTAPTAIGAPIALGLTFSPTPPSHGLAPNGGAFAHPDARSKGAGPIPANQFGDAIPSSIDPLSRQAKERLEHMNGELQPGRQSSPPRAGTEATPSARREHDDKQAEVATVTDADYSPLRPPSPDSNAGLQGYAYHPLRASQWLRDDPGGHSFRPLAAHARAKGKTTHVRLLESDHEDPRTMEILARTTPATARTRLVDAWVTLNGFGGRHRVPYVVAGSREL